MKLEINIDQTILNRSANCTENLGQNCAVALAIFDIFGQHSWVESEQILITSMEHLKYDIILTNNIMATILLPEKVTEFIMEFDQNLPHERKEMTPFAFEIEIPDNVIEMISIDEIYKVLETSTCLKLVEA